MSNLEWNEINISENKDNNVLLEHRNCPTCNEDNFRTVITLNNFQFFSDSNESKQVDINQQQCKKCATISMNPCYSNKGLEQLFAEAGQSYGSSLEHTKEQISWLQRYELLGAGNRILDVGCYDGSFLSNLSEEIIKLGVDIDEQAIKRGSELYSNHNIQFFHGDFESFAFSGPSPDVITMYHVLEHLARPIETLEKLYDISKETTKLVIEVPILENGKTNDINSFFSVQHMTHFSRNSLLNCLSLAGWLVEDFYEAKDYNGYRVIASKMKEPILVSQIKDSKDDWLKLNSILSSWYQTIEDTEKALYN